MELDGYVDRLRTEFSALGEAAGEETRAVAERLLAPLHSTTRLILLEALAEAADEITLELAPASVHVRLRGSDPEFVVTGAPATPPAATEAPPVAPSAPAVTDGESGPVARINFRPPETLKTRIEEAAGRDGLSVNTWLTRVAAAALDRPAATSDRPDAARRGRVGWFG
ncbi:MULTISPECIES: hypothetical protein [unclassified Pseudonocardia]|uniref:hypothetical protein n=1 Tax=unclassified Pseudonocardia TaxID=2619320 RepID=UPI001CF718AC|nr:MULTISPECIES: hypothetical protein [unclassified Pseudonocardia]